VLIRDGLCCSFIGLDGTRCGNKVGLELEHELPFGMGAGHAEANLQVLYTRHNLLEAERCMGVVSWANIAASNATQKHPRN
jgi:hypothetical protein